MAAIVAIGAEVTLTALHVTRGPRRYVLETLIAQHVVAKIKVAFDRLEAARKAHYERFLEIPIVRDLRSIAELISEFVREVPPELIEEYHEDLLEFETVQLTITAVEGATPQLRDARDKIRGLYEDVMKRT